MLCTVLVGSGGERVVPALFEQISPNASDLLDFLVEGPGMIDTMVSSVFDRCKHKGDTVMGAATSRRSGRATPAIAMKVVELANDAE